jgi:hypothetical protein
MNASRSMKVFGVLLAVIVLVTINSLFSSSVNSRPLSARNAIIANLKQIEGAKEIWMIETKSSSSAIPRSKELAQYLHGKRMPPPVADEIYVPGALNEPAQAVIVKKIDKYPRGTIIRMNEKGDFMIIQP